MKAGALHALIGGLMMLAGCFAPPSYVGRDCESNADCPGDLYCSDDKECVDDEDSKTPAKPGEPDGGLPGPNVLPSTQPDASTTPIPPRPQDGGVVDGGPPAGRTCSPSSSQPTTLTVKNRCTFAAEVVWLDGNCNEQVVVAVPPGQTKVVNTFVSHEFLFRGQVSKEPIGNLPPLNDTVQIALCKGLVNRYSFNNDASDPVRGANGTLRGGTAIQAGTLFLNGVDGYASLPIAPVLGILHSATIDVWFGWIGPGPWARVFDFGSGPGSHMFFTPRNGVDQAMFGVRPVNGADEWLTATGYIVLDTRVHVTITIDKLANQTRLYLNGVLAASGNFAVSPADLGPSNNNFLGRSQFIEDPYLEGGIDELRIYQDALTPEEVAENDRLGLEVVPPVRP